jgi:endoglucanase
MKKLFQILPVITATLLIVALFSNNCLAQGPFNRGVNLTGWFQTSGVKQVQFTKYTKKDFENIKSLGCDVIRLPIDMTAMTKGSPDYVIDSLFYFFLDSAVTWAEDLELHLILDNHTMDPGTNTASNIGAMLQKIWVQVAQHYKNRSRYIYYELRNEPHGIGTSTWGTIQKNLISAIRAIDTVHTIVVGGSGWNTYSEMKYLPVFSDTNLIYTFHFYDPFLFTHQGATWPTPSMGSLGGVPFPYDSARMPACPDDLKGTWIESSLANSYKTDGTVAKVKQLIDIAAAFKNSRNVKVYCGEFGVYDLKSDTADRVAWYDTVRAYLEEKGISWTIWDYHGGFGIFNKGSSGLFEYDLNTPMVAALGLNVPEQSSWVSVPDTTGFPIYRDFVESNLKESSAISSGSIDFYCTDSTRAGKYCIKFSGVNQYANIGFDMSPNRDLSWLRSNKYFVEFWVRGDTSIIRFDVRFVDTKTGSDDHPWRMNRTISNSIVPMNGKWQYLKLPLTSFVDGGSWDGAWFGPAGMFDWTDVDRMEFVSEQAPLTNATLWFDHISITDTSTVLTSLKEYPILDPAVGFQIYPNPLDASSVASYSVEKAGLVDISVFTVTGQKIATLVNRYHSTGHYTVPIHSNLQAGNTLPHGIYLCRFSTPGYSQVIKVLVSE